MRIAINARFLIKGKLEGIGIYTHEICRKLVQRHPEIDFHLIFDRPFDPLFIYGDNVTPHVVGPPARHPLLWHYWFEFKLPGLLRKINADAFFSPDGFLSLKSSVPTLMTTHDLAYCHFPEHLKQSHLWHARRFIPKYHERAEGINCVSRFTRDDILRQFKIHEKKLRIAGNACREGFRVLSESEVRLFREKHSFGRPYFLYLGSIHPRKNIACLIKAFDHYQQTGGDEQMLLILAGRWAWKTAEINRALNSSPNVDKIICVKSPNPIIYDLMASAKCLCYVSLFEGFGIPVLEAMKSGVPVITSRNSSMSEVAEDAALLVDPMDYKKIGEAMKTMDNNEDLRKSLINAGLKRSQFYSWEDSAQCVADHLFSLVRPR